MRVLLIGPHSNKENAERAFMTPALGIVRLAGYLNAHDHEAEVFDPNLRMLTGDGPGLEELFSKNAWDFIGFSVLEETLVNDIQNMHLAHQICPKAKLVAGGIEAQFNYQTVLDKSPCEYVILSEGELALLALVNGEPIENIRGIVFKSNSVPLSQELFNEATATIEWEKNAYEKYWDFYLTKYGDKATPENLQEIFTIRVFSRNRCPIGCKFCSSTNQITWGSGSSVPVISATEETLIDTIIRIKKVHPKVKTIYLTDDDFCIDRRSVIRFCRKAIEQDFGDLSFMCFARASDLTDEMCTWMKKANFRRLNVGIESFSEKVLEEMNKRCDVAKNHAGLAMLKRHDIKPFMNMLLTTPGSDLDDLEVTVDNALLYAADPFFHVGVTLGVKPLKGTDFFEEHVDFLSGLEPIPGTKHFIKRDDLILANDPQVRWLQLKYWNTVDAVIEKNIQMNDVRHTLGANVSLYKLQYVKSLIEESRSRGGKSGPGSSKEPENNTYKLDSVNMPHHEHQTVDIPESTDSIEHRSSKGTKQSIYGRY